MAPSTTLALMWLLGWLVVSAIVVWALNNEPSNDSRIRSLMDRQPVAVIGLFFVWPFVLIGTVVALARHAWKAAAGSR